MNFFSRVLELLSSLFSSASGGDPKQRAELKKIETELRSLQPQIYKGMQVLPSFAEVFRTLHANLLPIKKLLDNTIASSDLKRQQRYTSILIETGFSDKSKEIFDSISYENRKKDFFEIRNDKKVLDSHKKSLEIVLRELTNESFRDIERAIGNLTMLSDLCNFSYVTMLREFDKSYSAESPDDKYNFCILPIEVLEKYLLDFYFVANSVVINGTLGRALCALAFTQQTDDTPTGYQESLLTNLRKVYSILSKIITSKTQKNMIRLIKSDPEFEPKFESSKTTYLAKYAESLRSQFEKDTQKISVEVQDELIEKEIKNLFENNETVTIESYNADTSNIFFRSGAGSFLWTTPMFVIKNFFKSYFDSKVQSLLNDLIVEGFFNNQQYKSDFSTAVFACIEGIKDLSEFEQTFGQGQKNDMALMSGLLQDSHKDPDFSKTLTQMIDSLNKQAKKLIQNTVSSIFTLTKILEDLIPDARRTNPEKIENLHVLFTSARNHDNFEFLENSFPMWQVFLDIMKNYAIIGDVRSE